MQLTRDLFAIAKLTSVAYAG